MPWLQPITVPFNRLQIVATVPSESGVYGVYDSNVCVFIGESWNLKARLLEIAGVLPEVGHLTIVYELCAEEARAARRAALAKELTPELDRARIVPPALPGISFQSRTGQ